MTKILVPTDFSSFAFSAAKAAVFIARQTKATIYLLHVVNAPADWSGLSAQTKKKYPNIEIQINEAETQLKKVAADKLFKGCKVKTYVIGGLIYDRIAAFAQSNNMDMIAIGAHGADEKDRLFIGSTTQRVIRTATCPVLSVKKNTEIKSIKKILFTSNFEENVSDAVRTVEKLASKTKAGVDFLYINTPGNFADTETAEKRMAKYASKSRTVKFNTFIYNESDVSKGILSFMERSKPDLVALITHGRRGQPAYHMSVTDSLLLHAGVPVLSFVLGKK
ncbi:Putative stress response protein [Fulvivirga imtechensis AK7]|uniref:Putative stress response protein n=1 Tax=Fulvivirga imtechensis AK7 TaxID=1237149 RepID=L8JZG5_9BACT|nr:universal stress protein [Fulvivirga imtechensis]ELR73054.1 Putative stress response protein [Fulvivirga imtechensis AK7]